MISTNEKRNISDVLQDLLILHEINVTELSRRINVSQPTIQRIVSGAYKQPRNTTLEPIARYFEISINQLRGIEPIPFLRLGKEKIIKNLPLFHYHDLQSWPIIQNNSNHCVVSNMNLSEEAFAMYMPDSSMEPVMPKGSILLIDPDKLPQHGSYVALKLKNFSGIIIRQLVTDTTKNFIKALSFDLSNFNITALTDEDKIIGVIMEIRMICEEYYTHPT